MAGPFIGVAIRQTADAGWSSVYYFNTADHATAIKALDGVNDAEMGLFTADVLCARLKVSDVTVKGDVQFTYPSTGKGGFVPTVGSTVATDPNYALAVQFVCGATNRFKKFLRGVPYTFFIGSDPASYQFSPEWAALLQTWATSVINGGVLLSRPGKFNNNQLVIVPITGWIQPPANSASVHMSVRRAGRPFGLRRGRRLVG